MTLRLRCIRCGDLADMDPASAVGWGLCTSCSRKDPLVSGRKPWRQFARCTKNMERHPTYKALTAALDAMESTPHGGLAP